MANATITIAIQAQNQANASLAALRQNLIQAQQAGTLTTNGFRLLTQGMNAAQQQANTWGQVVRSLQPPQQQAGVSAQFFGGALQQLLPVASAAAAGMLAMKLAMEAVSKVIDLVSGGINFLVSTSMRMNQAMESNRISFTTMLGSAKQADGFLREMADFAAKTPFRFDELVTASKRLMAMGFSAAEVRPLMESVGNAVAAVGGGKDGIDRITLALGQMQAKGKVMAQEMNQLAEVGIPAWQILADAMGITVEEAMKAGEQGKISAAVFMKAFNEFSRANYGDMMAKQSRTFEGAMSTIQDSVDMLIQAGTAPLFAELTKLTVAVADLVSDESLTRWVDSFAFALGKMITFIEFDLQKMFRGVSGLGDIFGKVGQFIVLNMGVIDAAFRTTGVLVGAVFNKIGSELSAVRNHLIGFVETMMTINTAMNLMAAGKFDQVGAEFDKLGAKLNKLGQDSAAGIAQANSELAALGDNLKGAFIDANMDIAAFRTFGEVGGASFDRVSAEIQKVGKEMDTGVLKMKSLQTQIEGFAAKEAEINTERAEKIGKIHADLKQTYDDALRSMGRKQEDWAREEAKLRETAIEKANALLEQYTDKNKTASDRIAEINRLLMVGQDRARMADLQAERAKLEAEIQSNTEAYGKKKAALDKEQAEKFAAFDRERARAIEDHNLAVTRAAEKAQSAINAQNAETANALQKIDEKKAAAEAALNAEIAKVVELQGKYDDLAHRISTMPAPNIAIPAGGRVEERAAGGPVTAGSPYIVGERGPELFVPSVSGSITPNGGVGGIDYDRLAEALARQPVTVVMDGERVASITRERLAYNQARGRSAYNVSGA